MQYHTRMLKICQRLFVTVWSSSKQMEEQHNMPAQLQSKPNCSPQQLVLLKLWPALSGTPSWQGLSREPNPCLPRIRYTGVVGGEQALGSFESKTAAPPLMHLQSLEHVPNWSCSPCVSWNNTGLCVHAYAHINFFHQNPVKWIRPSTVNLTWRSNTRNCEAAMKVHNSLSSMLVSLENIKIKNTSSKMVPSSAYFFHFARVQHEKNTTQKTHISGHHMGQLNHGSIILTKVNRVH